MPNDVSRSLVLVATFCLHDPFISLISIVFVNATSSQLLHEKARLLSADLGRSLSAIILADEVVSLALSVLWGSIIDAVGVGTAAGAAHVLAAIGLLLLAHGTRGFMTALLFRVAFAVGFSGLMVALVATLASIAGGHRVAEPADASDRDEVVAERDEEQEGSPLLQGKPPATSSSAGLLSGASALATGLGAVLAAFGTSRLPAVVGLVRAYDLIAFCQLLAGGLVFVFLRPPRSALEKVKKPHLESLTQGFRLLRGNADIALACVGSFASRAQTVVTTTAIPLLVQTAFVRTGECDDDVDNPLEVHDCRPAYGLSSSLVGTAQLLGLIAGPIIGVLVHKLGRTSTWLALGYGLGALGFVLLSTLPDGDPRHLGQSIPSVLLIGVAQGAGLTGSMIALAQARRPADSGSVAGASGAVYAFVGGLGIITVQLGLKDALSVFVMMAAIQAVASLCSVLHALK